MHNSCYEWDEDNDTCCDNGVTFEPSDPITISDDEITSTGRGNARNATLKDPQSTGRKRAAVLYPLNSDAPCEWQGLAKAGGGKHPIMGCRPEDNRKQSHRHHGPNKSTLENDRTNLHLICYWCHNIWHAKNDPDYNPNGPFTPHDPVTKAESTELALAAMEAFQTPDLQLDEDH